MMLKMNEGRKISLHKNLRMFFEDAYQKLISGIFDDIANGGANTFSMQSSFDTFFHQILLFLRLIISSFASLTHSLII